MLIRQIYIDTLCTFRFQTLPGKEEIRLDAIEANAPIKCIKSENFFRDTIDFIKNVAKNNKRSVGFDIIFDISPYLILHLSKCAKKEPCKDISPHFSAKAVKAIVSYLKIDKDYNDLLKSLPMSNIKSIDSIGSPRDLIDITNIIAFTSTGIKEYKECVKAVAAFGYVIGFYNNHLQTYCFKHKRVLCQTQKANTTRNYLHSAIFPFSGELLFSLPYKIKICEDLEILCIVGCEQSYTDLSNPIFRIINSINFFVKPFEQENIDDLVLSVRRFEFKTINEEKKLTLDFEQEVLSFEEKGKRTRAKEQGVKISKKQQTEESRSDNTLKRKNPVSTQSGAQVYAEKEEEIFDEEFFRSYLAQTGPKETYSTATKIRFENRLANEMLDAKIYAKINETSVAAMGSDEVEKEVLALLENELDRIIRIEKKAIVDYNMLAYISKKIEKMLTDREVDACDIETIPKEEVGALCNA